MLKWLKAFVAGIRSFCAEPAPIDYGQCEYCRTKLTAHSQWLEDSDGRKWHVSCLRHAKWIEGLKKLVNEEKEKRSK